MKSLITLKNNKNATLSLNIAPSEVPKEVLEHFRVVEDVEDFEPGRIVMVNEKGEVLTGSLSGVKVLVTALSKAGVLESALVEVEDPSGLPIETDGRVFSTRSYTHKSVSNQDGLAYQEEVQEVYDNLGLSGLDAASVKFSDKTKQAHLSVKGQVPGFSVNGSTEYVLSVLNNPDVQDALSQVASLMGDLEESMARANQALDRIRSSAASK